MSYAPEEQEALHDQIADGFAEAIFTSAWADAYEEAFGQSPVGPGENIATAAPAPPPEAYSAANQVVPQIARMNGASLPQLWQRAQQDPYDAPDDPSEFGWQLGMGWLGHGTPVPSDIETPHGEFAVDVTGPNPGDYVVVYSSHQGLSGPRGSGRRKAARSRRNPRQMCRDRRGRFTRC